MKITTPFLSGLALVASLSAVRPVQAHFLWAEIGTEPQAKLHVTIAEASGETTTGALLERIKPASAWDASGKTLTLAPDAISMASPFGSNVAGAFQNWGVLDKTAEKRGIFLLEYYAKAARSIEDAAQPVKLPVELFLRRDAAGASTCIATLKHNGVAVANANIKLHEPNVEEPRDLTSDANGEVRFEAAKPGLYGLRATVAENRKGEYQNKAFDLIRNYSTLTFTVGGAATTARTQAVGQQNAALKPATADAKPLAASVPQADPAAYALLKAASESRQVMPDDFPGFTAKLAFNSGDKQFNGTVRYERGAAVTIDVPGLTAEDKGWLEDQAGSIIGHRRGGDFATGDGRHPLRFGQAADNSFGKLIELGDRMNSSYRVHNNKVTEVTRQAGDTRFTISVMDTMQADPGKYLSTRFMVSYRNKTTSVLQQVEAFEDKYAQVGKIWLPISRTVTTFDNDTTPHTRRLEFKDVQVLAVK